MFTVNRYIERLEFPFWEKYWELYVLRDFMIQRESRVPLVYSPVQRICQVPAYYICNFSDVSCCIPGQYFHSRGFFLCWNSQKLLGPPASVPATSHSPSHPMFPMAVCLSFPWHHMSPSHKLSLTYIHSTSSVPVKNYQWGTTLN